MYTTQDAIRDAKFVAESLNANLKTDLFTAIPNVGSGGIKVLFDNRVPSEFFFHCGIEKYLMDFGFQCFHDCDGVTVYSAQEYEEYTRDVEH